MQLSRQELLAVLYDYEPENKLPEHKLLGEMLGVTLVDLGLVKMGGVRRKSTPPEVIEAQKDALFWVRHRSTKPYSFKWVCDHLHPDLAEHLTTLIDKVYPRKKRKKYALRRISSHRRFSTCTKGD